MNQICDMVVIARYLNVTLIVPELDKTSFWNDPRFVYFLQIFLSPILFLEPLVDFILLLKCNIVMQTSFSPCFSEFQDIFDTEHFITSLRDEVRILRELPPRVKRRVELGKFHSMPPISWSDISYYHKQVRYVWCLAHYSIPHWMLLFDDDHFFILCRFFLWFRSTRSSIWIELMLGWQIMVCLWRSRDCVAGWIMLHWNLRPKLKS